MDDTYLTSRLVRSRYNCSDMSLWRWQRDPDLGFPEPLRINGRRLWKLADLEAWERRRAASVREAA
jgi:predicted DNA-binding transcriptional regulator AlpA